MLFDEKIDQHSRVEHHCSIEKGKKSDNCKNGYVTDKPYATLNSKNIFGSDIEFTLEDAIREEYVLLLERNKYANANSSLIIENNRVLRTLYKVKYGSFNEDGFANWIITLQKKYGVQK